MDAKDRPDLQEEQGGKGFVSTADLGKGKEQAQAYGEQKGRPRRRPKSFELKLTVGQFFRMLKLMLTIDLLAIVAFLGLLFLDLEHKAAEINHMTAEEITRSEHLLPGLTTSVQDRQVSKVRLRGQLERTLDLASDSARWLHAVPSDQPVFSWWRIRPVYTVSIPQEGGGYLWVSFDIGSKVGQMWNTLLIMLAVEFFMLISNTAATRRSVKRTLAPIQQLAVATHNISAASVGQAVGRQQADSYDKKSGKKGDKHSPLEKYVEPGRVKGRKRRAEYRIQQPYTRHYQQPEELKLSGTIDTLNKITAKHLDARIPIDSERQELRGLASAVNSMLDRLDAAYSSQLRFVSDASHELRTPIAVLQGYANMLDRWGKEDPAVLQESIEAIKAEAEGMKVLVDQLLFLARGDNNTIAMQVQPLDVSDFASDVLRETQLIDSNHTFVSDFRGGALWVDGDVALLKQALRVFVDNAVKYSPPGSQIKISTSEGEGWTRVSVTDNGIGIPEEDLPHVFERFYRSDESRARATGGTGLGLSIAKWIVERHGGHLEILSREEIGSRLTMVLPTAAEPSDEDDEEPDGEVV